MSNSEIEKGRFTSESQTDWNALSQSRNAVNNSTNDTHNKAGTILPKKPLQNENQDSLSGKVRKTSGESFIHELETLLGSLEISPQNLAQRIKTSLPVWLKCWECYPQLSSHYLGVLINSFATLPSLQVLKKLPPITLFKEAVECYFRNLKLCKYNSSYFLLKKVELVIELVKVRSKIIQRGLNHSYMESKIKMTFKS